MKVSTGSNDSLVWLVSSRPVGPRCESLYTIMIYASLKKIDLTSLVMNLNPIRALLDYLIVENQHGLTDGGFKANFDALWFGRALIGYILGVIELTAP